MVTEWPIFANETETKPLQSLTNESRPNSYLLSLANETETHTSSVSLARPRLSLKWSRTQDQDRDYTNVGFINKTG